MKARFSSKMPPTPSMSLPGRWATVTRRGPTSLRMGPTRVVMSFRTAGTASSAMAQAATAMTAITTIRGGLNVKSDCVPAAMPKTKSSRICEVNAMTWETPTLAAARAG